MTRAEAEALPSSSLVAATPYFLHGARMEQRPCGWLEGCLSCSATPFLVLGKGQLFLSVCTGFLGCQLFTVQLRLWEQEENPGNLPLRHSVVLCPQSPWLLCFFCPPDILRFTSHTLPRMCQHTAQEEHRREPFSPFNRYNAILCAMKSEIEVGDVAQLAEGFPSVH